MTLDDRIQRLKSGPQGVKILERLVAQAESSLKLETRHGKAKGRGQSSKQKGRNAVVQVRDLLAATFNVKPDEMVVKATSMPGVDLYLSPYLKQRFPYSIEVKCVENLNIWGALSQARENAEQGFQPILFFKRAKTPMFVAIEAGEFLSLCMRLTGG